MHPFFRCRSSLATQEDGACLIFLTRRSLRVLDLNKLSSRLNMPTITIGELSKESGVHLETIRYYEREGLIPAPPRKSSGHRTYPPNAARRLRFIKRGPELG